MIERNCRYILFYLINELDDQGDLCRASSHKVSHTNGRTVSQLSE